MLALMRRLALCDPVKDLGEGFDTSPGVCVQVVIAYVVSAYNERPTSAKLVTESKKDE